MFNWIYKLQEKYCSKNWRYKLWTKSNFKWIFLNYEQNISLKIEDSNEHNNILNKDANDEQNIILNSTYKLWTKILF